MCALPLSQTALHAEHIAASARMVDFAGWSMPVQYQGIIAEHTAIRTAVGLFDLSHMGRLRFRGPDANDFVQFLTVNDIAKLADGRAHYSMCCATDGGVLDDIVVYRLGAEILMVVNASNRERILTHIGALREAGSWTFTLDDETTRTAMIGVQGPLAQEYLTTLTRTNLDNIRYYAGSIGEVLGVRGLIARTGYTGEDGFELIVPADEAANLWRALLVERAGVTPIPCGLGSRDTLRLEAGMALYGHELNEDVTPYEAGLGRVVKLDKGDFVGRPALQALAAEKPARTVVGFELTGGGVPRQGYPVLRDGQNVGAVTSGTMSPSLRKPVGLAYVSTSSDWTVGDPCQIEIRGNAVDAKIVPVPFFAHRTRRVAPTPQ
jgi:aminomethyltransferase